MHDYFDRDVADGYDEEHLADGELDQTIDFLERLAGQGEVLEFAIGTGRVALPLKERGLTVAGIELSQPMVDKMREKPGGADIRVVIGDMAKARVEGSFGLVILVFNTICNLTSQDQQVACFQNAADHLDTGGHFVVETFVPPIQKLAFGEKLLAFAGSENHWGTDEIDVATQQMVSHHLWARDGAPLKRSIPFRYAWPSELDLMAKLAGLELVERWGDWDRTEFTNLSQRHVSVWRKMKVD